MRGMIKVGKLVGSVFLECKQLETLPEGNVNELNNALSVLGHRQSHLTAGQ